MGNNKQQISSHRQTHTYRAVPLNILREGGLSFRVIKPSGIPVAALNKIIKKYPLRIINGTSLNEALIMLKRVIHFHHDLIANFVSHAGPRVLDL